jgi:hypothetical protein
LKFSRHESQHSASSGPLPTAERILFGNVAFAPSLLAEILGDERGEDPVPTEAAAITSGVEPEMNKLNREKG